MCAGACKRRRVFSICLWLLSTAVIPGVENPWPDSIGIELPFAFAGAGGVLASTWRGDSSRAEQERAIIKGGIWGFRLGALTYLIALANQVTFGL